VIDFADALKLPRFAVCGFDWGGPPRVSPLRCIRIVFRAGRADRRLLDPKYVTPGPPGRRQASETRVSVVFQYRQAARFDEESKRALQVMWQNGRRRGNSATNV